MVIFMTVRIRSVVIIPKWQCLTVGERQSMIFSGTTQNISRNETTELYITDWILI